MPLSFSLTTDLINSLTKLDNQFAEAFATLKNCTHEELDSLHKYARVGTIGASTRIENALLTDIEVNWLDTILTEHAKPTGFNQNRHLIENKLSKDRERSIEEVAGCRAMLLLIYSNPMDFVPLKENDLRALHYELMSPYRKAIPYAGKYKTQSNSVIEYNKATKKSRTVFRTADPGVITSSAMHELIAWYNKTICMNPWHIATTSELVYRFLAIHPFQDGNGRLGRAMFLMSLLQSKSNIISFVTKYVTIDRYIEKHKEEYYFVLNQCSDGYFKED
ncbi:MAG: Fic family protein, partial [Pseudomonadota bacterium]